MVESFGSEARHLPVGNGAGKGHHASLTDKAEGRFGTEIKEDALYARRAYYFNNEVHGMHYGEFAKYTDYFAQALLEKRPYSPNLAEGLETFCVMEAVRQSAQTREPVHIAPLLKAIGL